MKKRENKKKKGISLIVLIITIAVIIILASAVILSIANNRPIDSAKEATEAHNNAVLKESAAVLSAQWKTDSLLGNTTLSRSEYVKEGLKTQGFTEEIGDIVIDDTTGEVVLIGAAKEVAKSPSEYYGKYITNYTVDVASDIKWKIFHSDGENIYLIADNYIPYEAVPTGKNGDKWKQGNTSYERTVYVGNPTLKGYSYKVKDIKDARIKKLIADYYNYLITNGKEDMNLWSGMVAMLDFDMWSSFANESAEYAIGGPTVELFLNSYNNLYKTSYKSAFYGNGYFSGGESTNISFNQDDSLYVIKTIKDAYGLSLASYYGNGGGCVQVLYDDRLAADYDPSSCGLRPVVCLKADVELEKQSDGYIIK